MNIAAVAFVAVILPILNRVRGGGFGAERLPGHPRYYVAPAVALVAMMLLPWEQAAAFGTGYLVWSVVPWGWLMCLGRYEPPREISAIESVLLDLSGGNIWIALFLRHAIFVLPGLIAVALLGGREWLVVLALPFGLLAVAAYELGWRLRPRAPIELAEILTGGLWAALLICAGVGR